MKKNEILKLHLSEEMARKLTYVSEKERMTVQNEIIFLIRQKISYFERVKGNITREQQNSVSLEQFDEE
ncbi:MAG: hypothetical protein II984_06300 [Clostridia bacterium]|nr:hypothetical protein [Clostridia bacterium]